MAGDDNSNGGDGFSIIYGVEDFDISKFMHFDGYVVDVTIFNFQQYRHIEAPGWQLGWTWKKKEVIWAVMGGQATEQGDCSKFKGNTPHCCMKTPTIVDLLRGVPYNQYVSNCCRGSVISSWAQDPATVRTPRN